ncbi:MAG: FAD-dependent monooxygenase [bacterium]|nr:FAD-dependent monooxygenase [bacterium]
MHVRVDLALTPAQAADPISVREHAAMESGIAADDISSVQVARRSIDARARYTVVRLVVDVYANEEPPSASPLLDAFRDVSNAPACIIVGAGPAGYFAALELIELGIKPIVIERGKDARARRKDLRAIQQFGIVDPHSNYCFGEGGAGTYSDGKLYTRSHKRGSIDKVLRLLVEHGASRDILVDAHPHIGSNKLWTVVRDIRETILRFGGEVRFESFVTDFIITRKRQPSTYAATTISADATTISADAATISADAATISADAATISADATTISADAKTISVDAVPISADDEAAIEGVVLANGEEVRAKNVILATGHSARDIFRLCVQRGILVEPKPFALGVRIEHPQALIDEVQYSGSATDAHLPAASYSLVCQANGRGVFSFCMCPGGLMVPSATSPGEIVINGMSMSRRDSPFANAGTVVAVEPEDWQGYAHAGPLAAMEYQAASEIAAFESNGDQSQRAPAQRLTDFLAGKVSSTLPKTSYIPGHASVDIRAILPQGVSDRLLIGVRRFGEMMRSYLTEEAVVVAVESRTSSPVRIPRDPKTLQHPTIRGLFPCGEGAGYAGGIVSAALDGQNVARALSNRS